MGIRIKNIIDLNYQCKVSKQSQSCDSECKIRQSTLRIRSDYIHTLPDAWYTNQAHTCSWYIILCDSFMDNLMFKIHKYIVDVNTSTGSVCISIGKRKSKEYLSM